MLLFPDRSKRTRTVAAGGQISNRTFPYPLSSWSWNDGPLRLMEALVPAPAATALMSPPPPPTLDKAMEKRPRLEFLLDEPDVERPKRRLFLPPDAGRTARWDCSCRRRAGAVASSSVREELDDAVLGSLDDDLAVLVPGLETSGLSRLRLDSPMLRLSEVSTSASASTSVSRSRSSLMSESAPTTKSLLLASSSSLKSASTLKSRSNALKSSSTVTKDMFCGISLSLKLISSGNSSTTSRVGHTDFLNGERLARPISCFSFLMNKKKRRRRKNPPAQEKQQQQQQIDEVYKSGIYFVLRCCRWWCQNESDVSVSVLFFCAGAAVVVSVLVMTPFSLSLYLSLSFRQRSLSRQFFFCA